MAMKAQSGLVPMPLNSSAMLSMLNCQNFGREVGKGDEAAVVESVKAASEVYAPVGGEVTAVNETLEDAPETVNASADGEGWFLPLRMAKAGS